MNKLNKTKIFITLGILLITIGGVLIYKNYQNDLKIQCTDSNNLEYVNYCMEIGKLYPQEQYDAYYNVASNNPPLSIIKDERFFMGFSLAYNNCDSNLKPYGCNKRDKNVLSDFMEKCTFNAYKSTFCTQMYFYTTTPNKENIKQFIKIVNQKIDENANQSKTKKYTSNWYCDNQYKSFYDKIGKNLIDLIPKNIQQICNKQ